MIRMSKPLLAISKPVCRTKKKKKKKSWCASISTSATENQALKKKKLKLVRSVEISKGKFGL